MKTFEISYTVKLSVQAESREQAVAIADQRLREYPDGYSGAVWVLQDEPMKVPVKVSYKTSDGKTVTETFDSELKFRAWFESLTKAVWAEHCQGSGDGSLDHLEIKIMEKEEPKM